MVEKLNTSADQKEWTSAQNQKVLTKMKELEKENERLKRLEREYDYLKNQNAAFKQSIDNYEARYNDLKKYCLKIEPAYMKLASNKKLDKSIKIPSSS